MAASTLGHDCAILNLSPHNIKCNASKNMSCLQYHIVKSDFKKIKESEWSGTHYSCATGSVSEKLK